MDCPICGTTMELMEDDDRQEWRRMHYFCSECQKEHNRLITYKQQSTMVESDEWEKDEKVGTKFSEMSDKALKSLVKYGIDALNANSFNSSNLENMEQSIQELMARGYNVQKKQTISFGHKTSQALAKVLTERKELVKKWLSEGKIEVLSGVCCTVPSEAFVQGITPRLITEVLKELAADEKKGRVQ